MYLVVTWHGVMDFVDFQAALYNAYALGGYLLDYDDFICRWCIIKTSSEIVQNTLDIADNYGTMGV